MIANQTPYSRRAVHDGDDHVRRAADEREERRELNAAISM